MKTALVFGISGQDGFYISQLLVEKGYHVVGLSRDPSAARRRGVCREVTVEECDLLSFEKIASLLRAHSPREVYNLAGYATGSGMFDAPVAMGEVNGLTVTRILEAIKTVDPTIRFCQASSSEIFGDTAQSPQTECTLPSPRTPYGSAKLYAHSIVGVYRKQHSLFACSAVLYNHESPRRGSAYVTGKIAEAAAAIKLGLAETVTIGDLEARRDWGFAGDYARAMWMMLQAESASDYVIATGRLHSVKELCDIAFAHVGLDFRDHVRVDGGEVRAAETSQLVGNANKARELLGWSPQVAFKEIVKMMVDAELERFGTVKAVNRG